MADKSPRKPGSKKPSQAQRETNSQEAHARERVGPVRGGGPGPSETPPVGCWYEDPQHQPRMGWCPLSCNSPVTHSERAGNGDQHVYCEAHAHWRRKTIRLPLVRRLRLGERPNPAEPASAATPRTHSPGGSMSPEMA
jgi:hypothetical protein